MAGTIIADTWQNGDGTQNYKCRDWVNFNGTGTVAIRASGNVSSITDGGTGLYTVNFTTAMPDANYSAVNSHSVSNSNYVGDAFYELAVNYCRMELRQSSTNFDETLVCVAVFR